MATPERLREPAVLTSWKEVAAYLGKGVRTVQRWEKLDGMPVRRIAGTTKIVVRREDLDTWLRVQTVLNGGSTGLEEMLGGLELHRQLRQQNRQLRGEVHDRVEQLIAECRRMSFICCGGGEESPSNQVAPATSARKKT